MTCGESGWGGGHQGPRQLWGTTPAGDRHSTLAASIKRSLLIFHFWCRGIGLSPYGSSTSGAAQYLLNGHGTGAIGTNNSHVGSACHLAAMETLDAAIPRLPGQCLHKLPTKCQLTAMPTCCACQDKRPHSYTYSKYIDGIGFSWRATRQERYCPHCQGNLTSS